MHWGIEQAQVGPIAAPGKYTVRLTVDGQSLTQPFEILKDPEDRRTGRRPGGVDAAAAAASATTSAPRPT